MTTMKVLNLKELCEFLKISKTTAYVLIHSKGFPKIKIGRTWRFEEEALKQWVKESTNIYTA